MRTALTALVSAIIGGLITALFLVVGVYGLDEKSENVTIKEVTPPQGSSRTTVSDDGTSVPEV